MCPYRAHGSLLDESRPPLIELGHIELVAGDGFGLGIVFSYRLLDETHRLTLLSPATQGGQSKPAPPAIILETDGPFGAGLGHRHQSVAAFSFVQGVRRSDPAFRSPPSLLEGAKQPGFEGLALSIRKLTDKDWSFHGYYGNSQPEIYAEDAPIPGGEHQAHEGRNKS
jgi:hypothetical protein